MAAFSFLTQASRSCGEWPEPALRAGADRLPASDVSGIYGPLEATIPFPEVRH